MILKSSSILPPLTGVKDADQAFEGVLKAEGYN